MLKLKLEPAETVNPESGRINVISRHSGIAHSIGDGELLFYNKEGGLYTISKADIENWQNTGKFSFNKLTIKGDGLFYNRISEQNNLLSAFDGNDKRIFYIADFNPDTHTLTTTARYDWSFNSNGYILKDIRTGTTLDFVIVKPSGERIVTNVPVAVYKNGRGYYTGEWKSHGLNAEGYVGYVCYEEKSDHNVKPADSEDDCTMVFKTTHYNLSLIKTDGTLECIWKHSINSALSKITLELMANYSLIRIVEENFYSGYQRGWIADPKDKTVKEMGVPEMTEGVMNSLGELVYQENDKGEFVRAELTYCTKENCPIAIMFDYKVYDDETREKTPEFLVTLSGERVSENYESLWSHDFEIFLAHTADDKWGYIDKTGKPIDFFDDAGEFAGEYAPVVKDGKAYFINRKMEQVSESIDAYAVATYGDGLYKATINGKQYFMTYMQDE